jgi:hypothetical protein
MIISLKNKVPFILFIESSLLFLFGGLSSLSDTIFINKVRQFFFEYKENWDVKRSIENFKKNDLYILEGLLLIIESVLLSYLFG